MLAEAAQSSMNQASAASDALRKIARDFEEGTGKTTAQVTAAGDLLRQGIRDLTASSDRISQQVRGAGESLRRQSHELFEATERTGAKLESAFEMLRQKSNDLGITGERLSTQAEGLAATFQRQAEDLVRASKLAEERAQQLEGQRSAASVETFLKNAAYVVEKLQSLSVDIARVFQTNLDEKSWREFHAGDQGVFVRKILKTVDRNQMNAVKNKYEDDGEFRDYVTRYLADFESLLTQARNADHADVLTATFTSAEVGKLYLLLARALGRLD